MNLNKVFIIGRVTSDVALKATATNQPVSNFSVATNRVWKDKNGAKQESSEFHNIVVWGRQAEIASQFLTKGAMVMIEGRLQTRSWKDTNDQNHKITEIVCENIQLGPRAGGAVGGGSSSSYTPRPSSVKPKGTATDAIDTMGDLEEDIPEISLDEAEIKPEDLPF
ncbi:MAG: single-stranded DNA-binding protein [Candidatus Paceibacterota bacterium]